ncbi:MAG: branched-chain amino acid aminotransferase [Planctomycetota bacterium]|jgi:hypothetical protein|nr:branched-chain amino acid aminotransferase [Planctomycetota bacterium]MDA0920690.1 branched-chain amino acid aminotransferase [Planctomycetota bacterium]MDA1161075.1 branched-chain amino acid aminotransferase [Planctomycetota bacterium]|tara:strand:- start:67549 stop:67851 length:303 start_codon:yes stop_codon:yes gene_type:complete
MTNIFTKLINDETGFIVSAELILVATIAVLGVVVGLSEIAFGINNELEDVASAFGSVNQSFYVNGLHSEGKACTAGSEYNDSHDNCDSQWDIVGSGTLAE